MFPGNKKQSGVNLRMGDELKGYSDSLIVKSDTETSAFPNSQFMEDVYKQRFPAYSLLLYRPTSLCEVQDQEQDQSLACRQSSFQVPVRVQPVCLSQIPAPIHASSTATGLSQSTVSQSQLNLNDTTNSQQQLDPFWLQFLSNIMTRQPHTKQGDNSAPDQDATPSATCLLTKVGAMNAGMAMDIPRCQSENPTSSSKAKKHSQRQKNKTSLVKLPKGQLILVSPVTSSSPNNHGLNNKLSAINSGLVNLNSSGEESQQPSPLGSDVNFTMKETHSSSAEYNIPLMCSSPLMDQDKEPGQMRESHNMKERRRRARIKDACNLMRQLVPGISKKTDKATVFEFSARYIHFLKSFVGTNNDKDFLVKYNPY
ncbi:hypothetical protein BgiMline_023698 [Biomphalaria glabrata]|nr:hypothetical protein BgiMline_006940 [Biomphalaria glabrata]